MSTLVDWTYKDNQGSIKTIQIDAEYESQMTNIPEEFEHSISMTDDQSVSETHQFVGPAMKRN